ncbi:hypothetical protein OG589_20090 [Sphaerisporangium sp. NBC_01403]
MVRHPDLKNPQNLRDPRDPQSLEGLLPAVARLAGGHTVLIAG